MTVQYTKEVQEVLERHKKDPINSKIWNFYRAADDESKKIIHAPSSLDKEVIEYAEKEYDKRGSSFTKKEYILMGLKTKVLYFACGMNRYEENPDEAKYGWQKFKSPTEVLASTIPIKIIKWDHRLVNFNVKLVNFNANDPIKTYEVDQNWIRPDGNSFFIFDVNSRLTHKNREDVDRKKFEYFNSYTNYLQINGGALVSNYVGVCRLIQKLVSKSDR
ncbi:hypothetical protein [Lysinibacillus xylanilyticus]|uniref:hypothetical protein n=1 Tax=Lysinibacillus xylanilyticus TaxID=582475 RepID=UPI0038280F41